MKWLLDTNAIIHAIRNEPRNVRARLASVRPSDVSVSVISIAELWYGAEKSGGRAGRIAVFEAFLAPFEILPFDRRASEEHARLRYSLRHGPIGERDLLIAAIARANGLIVVTNNTREFGRVAGILTED